MNISRFFGITNREAMRQVRLALGSDALIVSNRRVNGGVEILATDPTSLSEAESAALARPLHGSVPAAPATHGPGPAAMGQQGQQGQQAGLPQPPSPHSPMSPMGAYAAAFQAAHGPLAVETDAPAAMVQASPGGPAAAPAAHVPLTPPVAPSMQPPPPVHRAPSGHAGHRSVPPAPVSQPPAMAARPVQAPAPAAPDNPYSTPAVGGEPQPGIMDAIGAMRGALETRIDELLWGNQLRRAPQAASLFQTLLGFGFSTALLRAMLKRLPEPLSSRAAFQWARQELISHLPVPVDEDVLWRPGLVLALVGPTGVGKTTTIAKLAARCVRRFGPGKLVLITTDTYRIGAHEQLKIYGQMLRVPVHVVRNANELRAVVQGVEADQVILIDNVGISQRDRYVGEQAAMLAAAGRDVTRLLVLNAASHGETLDEVARSYAADGGTPLKGCIITKVDEAIRLGAALDTALRYRLPIHYVSVGQKVPEHLVFLPAAELVDRALTNLPSSRSLYAPTEADFAALMSLTQAGAPDAEAGVEARRRQARGLPRLLSMAGGDASHLTSDDLRDGCEFIGELACASEAYDLWRGHMAADGERAPLASSVHHMLRVVQNEWSDSGHKHLLAVHDQAALRIDGESPVQLRTTSILNEQGAPLSSPMQQLSLPAGWLSSCGATQAQAPAMRGALLHQLDWLEHEAADLPVIHLFEGGNPALWRDLAARGLSWMAQVPAITRVHVEDGATTVQALAKTLPHHPAADPDYLFALVEVAGAAAAERAMWVAAAPVRIAARGQAPLALQMVSVRLVDRVSGKVVKSLLGLHPDLDLSSDKLAGWLVVKAESREALRHAAAAWALLASRDGQAGLQHKALLSAQVGLSTWQLRKSPLAERGRRLASAMLGKKGLPPANGAAAMLKLFALKEMLDA